MDTAEAAVAALLDAVFKPRCQIRVLGGSGQQSSRMFDYLTAFFHKSFARCLDGRVLKGRCRRLSARTLDAAALVACGVRVLLRRTGPVDWPTLRCPACESTDLYLFEDLR